ncbi:hypothetical protein D3C71_360930 [compost metagenome]|jgi:hypothetical protein
MIVTTDEWKMVRVFLDEPLPADFGERLLLEMMQIAKPYGRGALEAEATIRKDLGEIVASGMKKSRVDLNGLPHDHGAIHFDYVAGHRLKVSFYPRGLLDECGRPVPLDRGFPVVISRDFDMMYGDGALENVIRVALM